VDRAFDGVGRSRYRRRITSLFIALPDAEVILMGDADVRAAVGAVLAVLREAGRAEGTVRRHQVVLDRFAVFLAGRGLDTASEQVCIDFITNQTGVRLGSLRQSVRDRDVSAVRRPVLLMAEALAGRTVEVDRSAVAPADGCPVKFRALRDDYLASCHRRGNAEATLIAKDKAVSRFLGYLHETGADNLAVLGVRDVSGFLVHQRGLRRKTIASLRSPQSDRDELRPTMVTDQARHELVHRGLLARRSTDPRPGGRPASDHPYIKHADVSTTEIYARARRRRNQTQSDRKRLRATHPRCIAGLDLGHLPDRLARHTGTLTPTAARIM
jgi:hypothetical protein